MRAAVLHDYRQPLRVEDVPQPAPGPDEILVQVEVCGVCHSDVHVADGDWASVRGRLKLPRILGHEVVGRVVERGADVSSLALRERVGVPWVHWSCGACDTCREGFEHLCPQRKVTGLSAPGGYAEFLPAKASHAAKIPDGLQPSEAAPLLCAGVTAYRGLKKLS
ncbi:MAG: alcohol dehydrogenase catalytic domain-containing protein, partial [Terriglobia bacterium]